MSKDLKSKGLSYLESYLKEYRDKFYPDGKGKKDLVMDKDISPVKFMTILKGSQETFPTKRALLDYLNTIESYINYQMATIEKPTTKYNALIVVVFECLLTAMITRDPKVKYKHLEIAKVHMFQIRKSTSLYINPEAFPKAFYDDLKPLITNLLD